MPGGLAQGCFRSSSCVSVDARSSRSRKPQPAPPPPPAESPTVIVEDPDAVPPPPDATAACRAGHARADRSRRAADHRQRPERRSRPDASGFQLSTLETKNLSLLYIDPMQTYLTPYLGRAFEIAPGVPRKEFQLEAVGPHDDAAQGFLRLRQCRRARARPATWCCSTSRPCRCRWKPSRRASAFSRSPTTSSRTSRAIDVWNKRDAFWRRFLGGKPAPIQKHPGIDPLQFPHQPAGT